MTSIDDKKNSFEQRLQDIHQSHTTKRESQLAEMAAKLTKEIPAVEPKKILQRMAQFDADIDRSNKTRLPIQAQVGIGGSASLRELDSYFLKEFRTGQYLSANLMNYPTVFCETLEEFFGVLLNDMNISPAARQTRLDQMVNEARESAQETNGGGIFGVNLPGQGCYLNGWLFAYGSNQKPATLLQSPDTLASVLKTAAHEKLGHGFLAESSVLGQTKSRLGLSLVEVAKRFGIRSSEDPVSSLREQQNSAIFTSSMLVEEGWATWVESYIGSHFWQTRHPTYSFETVITPCLSIPGEMKEYTQILQTLAAAMILLLGDEQSNIHQCLSAVKYINETGSELDDYFMSNIGQSLRYCVGELLMSRIETKMGALCVPYAALIAANVAIEPDKISLSDLQTLLSTDPRLHPDARLAAIAQLNPAPDIKDNVSAMSRLIEQELSFSVPRQFLR